MNEFTSMAGSVGGEVTWKITPQLVTVFTATPTFRDEFDTRQINLTRFPLFSLRNALSFSKERISTISAWVLHVRSRRSSSHSSAENVGLLDGAQIPIDAGVSSTGRVGKWNLVSWMCRRRNDRA